ncbi:membrane protein [Pilimelia anulata]|uniref:Membrane protein n=1 Tax=Pilimelia anulata TaxID=53371 RepID=A0A8J3FCH6_9ACTN|nr:membrane protein [Pilimelia anulata]
MGSAAQARVNGALGARLGDGVAAAAVSFGVGLLLVGTATAAVPAGRRGARRLAAAVHAAVRPTAAAGRGTGERAGRLRWWECLGGLGGAAFVASQSLTAAVLGVAVFTVAVVAGQAVSGLLADRFGLGPHGRQPVSGARLAGAALTVGAVALAGGRPPPGVPVWLALLPALAGLGVGVQAAVNGRVRQVAGGAWPATLLNFAVGTAALLLLLAVDLAAGGAPGALPAAPWLYLGGPLGVTFILIAAATVRHTGVLLLALATIAGQLVGAVLLDLAAPGAAGPPGAGTYAAAALALAGTLVAAGRGLRSAGSPP